MIKLTNVTKIYKTGVRALNDVNLTMNLENLYMLSVQLVQENLLLLSYYIVKKNQLQEKLKL
mgnify:CR=1 FL=1